MLILKAWNKERVMTKRIPEYTSIKDLQRYLWGADKFGIKYELMTEQDFLKRRRLGCRVVR